MAWTPSCFTDLCPYWLNEEKHRCLEVKISKESSFSESSLYWNAAFAGCTLPSIKAFSKNRVTRRLSEIAMISSDMLRRKGLVQSPTLRPIVQTPTARSSRIFDVLISQRINIAPLMPLRQRKVQDPVVADNERALTHPFNHLPEL